MFAKLSGNYSAFWFFFSNLENRDDLNEWKEEVMTEKVILETPSTPGDFLKTSGRSQGHDDYFLHSSLNWENKKVLKVVKNKTMFG